MYNDVYKKSVVLDCSFIVGYCALEEDKFNIATVEVERLANMDYELFLPGVAIAEVVWTLKKKQVRGELDDTEYDASVTRFIGFSSLANNSPMGDISLIPRLAAIKKEYGANAAYDIAYMTLAEQLSQTRYAELITFDKDQHARTQKHCPNVVSVFFQAEE